MSVPEFEACQPQARILKQGSLPGDVRSRSVTGATVVGVRGHLLVVEAYIGRGLGDPVGSHDGRPSEPA